MLIKRRQVTACMLAIIVSLLLLSYAGQYCKFVLGHPTLYGLVDFFYVDMENNLPTAYQFLALLSCSLVIAVTPHDQYVKHWKILAIIFAFLAFDEAASIHELTIQPMWRLFGNLHGVWQPKWVIFGLAGVLVVGLYYLKFLFHLAPRERIQVILAAAIYVGGAVGVEMLTGLFVDSSDPTFKENLFYATMAHVEEGMEMFGILIFIDFLFQRSGDIILETAVLKRS